MENPEMDQSGMENVEQSSENIVHPEIRTDQNTIQTEDQPNNTQSCVNVKQGSHSDTQGSDNIEHESDNGAQGNFHLEHGDVNFAQGRDIQEGGYNVAQGSDDVAQESDHNELTDNNVAQGGDHIEQEGYNVAQESDKFPHGSVHDEQGSHNVVSTETHSSTNAMKTDGPANNIQGSVNVEQGSVNGQPGTDEARLPAPKKKRNYEIDIPVKLEWEDDEFYDNGFKKYRLRNKATKSYTYNAPNLNVMPIKKVNNNKVKREKTNPQPTKKRPKYKPLEMYDCDYCPEAFISSVGFLNHVFRKHKTSTFTCVLCSTVFNSNTQLIEHKATHKDESRTITCQECDEIFTDHCDYIVHELDHQNGMFYKCIECGKMLCRKKSMKEHIYTHFDPTILIKCEICQISFRTNYITKHMETHSKARKCVECGKIYTAKGMLEYHMVSHTGVKLFQCFYCGQGFANSGQRNIHMNTHTNKRPYECRVCFSKFALKNTLQKHMTTHELEAKYSCDICDKKFHYKKSLIDHLSMHSGTQRYRCQLCKVPISTHTGLRMHMLYKHSDERNFQCKVCDTWFKNQQAINRHNTTKSHLRNVIGAKMKSEECNESTHDQ